MIVIVLYSNTASIAFYITTTPMNSVTQDVFQLAKAVNMPSRFPMLTKLERVSTRGTCLFTKSDSKLALFSTFHTFFLNTWANIIGSTIEATEIEQFGVTSFGCLDSDISCEGLSGETTILTSSLGERFGIASPASTFQFLLDVLLGYDVKWLCNARKNDESSFYTNRITALERTVLQPELHRLGALFPFCDFSLNNDVDRQWNSSLLGSIDNLSDVEYWKNKLVYWEKRSCVVCGVPFFWTLFFPVKQRIGLAGADSKNAQSNSNAVKPTLSGDLVRRESQRMTNVSNASRVGKKIVGTLEEKDASGNRTVEFYVEIGRGETTLDKWRSLKTGSILTTNVSAQDLFTAFLDGQVFCKAKPGVYRGLPAAQIKGFLSSDD